MCQSIKHALQLRYGRVGVAAPRLKSHPDDAVAGGGAGPLFETPAEPASEQAGRRRRPGDVPGLVPDDALSVVGEEGGGGDDVRLRLVVGGPYGRTEAYDRPRVCGEVHDGLATCLDVPPEWLSVAPVECDDDGFVVTGFTPKQLHLNG